jgi:hypothetical protein
VVELGERIGTELHVVGAANPAFFVDPDDRGDVDDVVELGDPVLGVDQARVLGRGPFDERSRIIRASVERDRDRDEAFGAEFFVQRLPDRQVLAAASPGCIGDEKYFLPAVVRQPMSLSAEIGQLEVRGFQRREL